MATFRVERTKNYTVMSNHHLKDRGLTLKSKGLLSMMLSLADEWKGIAPWVSKRGISLRDFTTNDINDFYADEL